MKVWPEPNVGLIPQVSGGQSGSEYGRTYQVMERV